MKSRFYRMMNGLFASSIFFTCISAVVFLISIDPHDGKARLWNQSLVPLTGCGAIAILSGIYLFGVKSGTGYLRKPKMGTIYKIREVIKPSGLEEELVVLEELRLRGKPYETDGVKVFILESKKKPLLCYGGTCCGAIDKIATLRRSGCWETFPPEGKGKLVFHVPSPPGPKETAASERLKAGGMM